MHSRSGYARIARAARRVLKSILLPAALCLAGPALAGNVTEHPFLALPLAGDAAVREAELSGLAWLGEELVLLPQYPERFRKETPALFALPKARIIQAIVGDPAPLVPRRIELLDPQSRVKLPGYEGFEAVLFAEGRAYLTIETRVRGGMRGFLVAGRLVPGPDGAVESILLDRGPLAIGPITPLRNMSYEALVRCGDRIYALHEANGPAVNPAPKAQPFSLDLVPQEPIPFPNLDFRVTDAAGALETEEAGRFFVMNFHWSGEDRLLKPEKPDALARRYGQGRTHAAAPDVERIVALRCGEDRVRLVDEPPLQLELGLFPRNFEGLAGIEFRDGERLRRGFLVATDRHPATLFGFVERN